MSFVFSRQRFLCLSDVVHLIGLTSPGAQIGGLVGAHGILSIGELLPQTHNEYGAQACLFFPTW